MVPMAPSMTTIRFSSCSTSAAIRGLKGLVINPPPYPTPRRGREARWHGSVRSGTSLQSTKGGHRPRPSGRGGRLRAARRGGRLRAARRGGRLRAARRGGRLPRRRGGTVLEGDLLAGEADMDGPSVLQPPEQDLVGQRVAELGLDEPAQGPGPEDGVEALAGEMGPSLGSELDRHPPLPELRLELQHELVHDRLHDLEVEGLEAHDRVQAVAEFG